LETAALVTLAILAISAAVSSESSSVSGSAVMAVTIHGAPPLLYPLTEPTETVLEATRRGLDRQSSSTDVWRMGGRDLQA
jgi:hypothetical protein